ncbi:unnamed protein product, partial [Closterium sp. NIES-53]
MDRATHEPCCSHLQEVESLRQLLKCATEELQSARTAAAAQGQLHEARVRYLEEQLNVVKRERDELKEQLETAEQKHKQELDQARSDSHALIRPSITGTVTEPVDMARVTEPVVVARVEKVSMTRVESVSMQTAPSALTPGSSIQQFPQGDTWQMSPRTTTVYHHEQHHQQHQPAPHQSQQQQQVQQQVFHQ